MQKQRLLKLADLLEADANNPKGMKFDLRPIAIKADGREFSPGDVPKLDCGTVGCALGLAAISGAFKDKGFSFYINEFGFWPKYKGRAAREAAESFFGIDGNESCWLFIATSYPRHKRDGKAGELAVAKRIRDFVAGKAWPE